MKLKLFFIKAFILFFSLMVFITSDVFASSDYIYLDLNCGDVVLTASTYSGCVYKTVDGVTTTESYVELQHLSTNKYYIYQSNSSNQGITGYVDGNFVLPTYDSISSIISSNITNNTDVDNVITVWQKSANSVGRTATLNNIAITGNSTFDITIDNIWSSHHEKGTSRTNGGISFQTTTTGKTILKLKGDNRFGNIYYRNTSNDASLTFTSSDGDGEETGTLTVANLTTKSGNNYWNSAIGASDSGDHAHNIIINGGTIYAGTTVADNCTAIGGGGNGTGKVKITGGIVTAVSNSTGTAIGGGIGMSSAGGDAVVTITGGTVYAYNTGQAYAANVFVPGVAIGGGSSRYSNGNTSTTVNITGGTVYAESRGGVAIGGGSSATKNGGAATVNISNNANVTANSISGTYTYSGKQYVIKAGSGIGGGTGGTSGNGGAATVLISGGIVSSGTIGGGETISTSDTFSVGDANVTITDGEVEGRILMYKGTFIMSGGTLYGGSATNGGCVQMYSGEATISGGNIKNCEASNNGGAIYIAGGIFRSKGGSISLNKSNNGSGIYIADGTFEMTDGVIENNDVQVDGGGIYIGGNGTFTMSGGKINSNKSITGSGGGIYLASGTVTMINGSIENNHSTLNGGGISIGGTGTFTLGGGVISNNQTTSGDGGGIYLESGTVAMTNGSIENNKSSLNGGGVAIGGSGTFTMSGGEIKQNVTLTGNGGGIYIANGNIQINDGIIKENKSVNSTGGLGGGICVSSGSILMNDGTIENNEAKNGGGFYLTQGTFEIKNGSLISKNKAENGAGGYVVSGEFNLTGGTTSNNIATSNGGGYYIVDTETVDLSNGIISNNEAKNGGGFYQTQTSEHITSTTLSGTCYVNNNVARDGNGGGIYVDGGSVFRIVNGKVVYNKATGKPTEEDLKSNLYIGDQLTNTKMVYAKDSSGGVGGGVYIKNGTFTMKDEEGNDGTAAIFGNTAEYAADDLFAYGNGLTTFDAIPVITMEKDDAYLNSTDWFEDYPKGERHISLRISDSLNEVTSNDRYKSITSENLLVKADSVLTTSTDYICITMGANVGGIMLNIDDSKVGSDGMFIYTLSDENEEVKIKISVKQGKTTKITNLPIGSYVLKLNSEWSWKYTENFDAEIKKGSEIINFNDNEQINVNVVGGQTMVINTKYNIKYKKYFTKTLSIKIPLSYGNLVVSKEG